MAQAKTLEKRLEKAIAAGKPSKKTLEKKAEKHQKTARENKLISLKRQNTMELNKKKGSKGAALAVAKKEIKKAKHTKAKGPTREERAAARKKEDEARAKAKANRKCFTQDPNITTADLNTTKSPHWLLKLADLKKICTVKPNTPRSHGCSACKKAIRKEQLRCNNVTWRARVQAGTAGHHKQYRDKPTALVKKLLAVKLDPAKLLKQGGEGEKVGLPQTVLKKIAEVELPKERRGGPKPPKPAKGQGPKPTKAQQHAAKRMREDMKKRKPAKKPEAVLTDLKVSTVEDEAREALAADAAKPKGSVDKQMKAALKKHDAREEVPKKDLPAAPAQATLALKPSTVADLKQAAAKKNAPRPMPLEKGEIHAKDATAGKQYVVAGVPCKANGLVSMGGNDSYSFAPIAGGKPYLLTASAPISTT